MTTADSPPLVVPLPRIDGRRLVVDDVPTVLLGGQLHNSTSSSSLSELDDVFGRVRDLHASFVIGTVSWAMFEPLPGAFDFEHVDAQIEVARSHGLRLVLLWFGAFKNAASTYAPSWVRRDTDRFPRAVVRPGGTQSFTDADSMRKPVLSVFSPALLDADRGAFCALLQHLADTDPQHTVVMVQVENEVGLLSDSRDRSRGAEAAWLAPVPAALLAHLVTHRAQLAPELRAVWERGGAREEGTWEEVFGDDWQADEVFMAWAFASYVEAVAAAGAERKRLPLYTNAWLGPQPGQDRAGQYPSGGPGSRVVDVWKAGAPTLALVGPDIYIDDVEAAVTPYVRADNPLFVPESRFSVGNLFWTLGAGAVGFSVFGVDDARTDGQLSEAYRVLGGMRGIIAAAQAEDRIAAVLIHGDEKVDIDLGAGMTVRAQGLRARLNRMFVDAGVHAPPLAPPPPKPETFGDAVIPGFEDQRPLGLFVRDGDELLAVGQGLSFDVRVADRIVEIDSVERGCFSGDRWTPARILNGDELLQLLPLDHIGVARIRILQLATE